MESEEKLELLKRAIKQLIEEEKENDANRSSSSSHENFVAVCEGGDYNRRLLSKLLSQLESLKQDDMIEQTQPSGDAEEMDFTEVDEKNGAANKSCSVSSDSSEVGAEEIIKELKNVRRQNFFTHCLMSAMIVLTIAWQLSEVSLVLKVQEGLSHPVRALGSFVRGMLKGPDINLQEVDEATSAKQKPIVQASSLPGLKIPDLPRVELPAFDFDNDEE